MTYVSICHQQLLYLLSCQNLNNPNKRINVAFTFIAMAKAFFITRLIPFYLPCLDIIYNTPKLPPIYLILSPSHPPPSTFPTSHPCTPATPYRSPKISNYATFRQEHSTHFLLEPYLLPPTIRLSHYKRIPQNAHEHKPLSRLTSYAYVSASWSQAPRHSTFSAKNLLNYCASPNSYATSLKPLLSQSIHQVSDDQLPYKSFS